MMFKPLLILPELSIGMSHSTVLNLMHAVFSFSFVSVSEVESAVVVQPKQDDLLGSTYKTRSTADSLDGGGSSVLSRSGKRPSLIRQPKFRTIEHVLIEPPVISVPQFATQSELSQYLSMLGSSVYGYFESDFQYKPSIELWRTKSEIVPRWLSESGNLNLGSQIYRRGGTGVYHIENMPDKVIKYYAYCSSVTDPIDEVVVESYFMKLFESLSFPISPKVYFYSGFVSSIPDEDSRNVLYGKLPSINCSSSPPHIRYLVMDRVGPAIQEIVPRETGLPLADAMILGIGMIRALQRLHNTYNMIHGDTHYGNFALESDDSDNIILIDFARARIISQIDSVEACDTTKTSHDIDHRINPLATKWGIRSCAPSFRDDVYRAVQMVPMILYGDKNFGFLDILTASEEYVRIKDEANFWDFSNFPIAVEDGLVLAKKN